uniref:Uncharacterized protein n=1 Tax=Sus scrofa TaxID=9823 RepID=A0A8D0R276_PIG
GSSLSSGSPLIWIGEQGPTHTVPWELQVLGCKGQGRRGRTEQGGPSPPLHLPRLQPLLGSQLSGRTLEIIYSTEAPAPRGSQPWKIFSTSCFSWMYKGIGVILLL